MHVAPLFRGVGCVSRYTSRVIIHVIITYVGRRGLKLM